MNTDDVSNSVTYSGFETLAGSALKLQATYYPVARRNKIGDSAVSTIKDCTIAEGSSKTV